MDYIGWDGHGHAVLASATWFGLKWKASAGHLEENLHCDKVEDNLWNRGLMLVPSFRTLKIDLSQKKITPCQTGPHHEAVASQ